MTITDVLTVAHIRGVRLVVDGDELRAQGPFGSVSEALRRGLAEHKQAICAALGDGVHPDETLPDVVRVPAWCPNTETAIKSCIDAQRKAAA